MNEMRKFVWSLPIASRVEKTFQLIHGYSDSGVIIPFNLTNGAVRFYCTEGSAANAPVLFFRDATILDAANGKCKLVILPADTANLTPHRVFGQIRVKYGSPDDVYRFHGVVYLYGGAQP